MKEPLVSVLMTSYNREKYIGEAIESVLSSTYSNFELIIVDDGSQDSTVSIEEAYVEKDSRVKLYRNERNLGDYPNRNRAASYAKGEYIMSVDSDDYIFRDGIERCVTLMEANLQAKMGMFYYDDHKKIDPFVMEPGHAIHRHFFKKQFLIIGPGGTIIRRSFFEAIGGYPEKYGPANDMFFNLKVAAKSPVLLIPFDFFHYRRHEGQEVNNEFAYLYSSYCYLSDAFNELDLPLSKDQVEWLKKKNKRRFLMNNLQYFFKYKNFDNVRSALRNANFTVKDAWQAIIH